MGLVDDDVVVDPQPGGRRLRGRRLAWAGSDLVVRAGSTARYPAGRLARWLAGADCRARTPRDDAPMPADACPTDVARRGRPGSAATPARRGRRPGAPGRASSPSSGSGRTDLEIERKGDGTPVTQADKAAERFLREQIAGRFPDDAIVGEEEADRAGTSGRTWIIDPIDGTKAFTHGVPLYTNLLAVDDADGPAIGVINMPGAGRDRVRRPRARVLRGRPARPGSATAPAGRLVPVELRVRLLERRHAGRRPGVRAPPCAPGATATATPSVATGPDRRHVRSRGGPLGRGPHAGDPGRGRRAVHRPGRRQPTPAAARAWPPTATCTTSGSSASPACRPDRADPVITR